MAVDERDLIRTQLSAMLKKVPPKVNSGSVQMVRNFRDWHKKASKTLESQRSTKEQLMSCYNQAISYYS